jgi:PAS domain S-box-containing protein
VTGLARLGAWRGLRVDARWLETWAPPLGRREFWVVQALVVAIAVGHAINEWGGIVDLHGAEFLPVSLYLLPVVYAALNFGMRGAAPTAIWAFVLTIPNIALWHAGAGAGALGELWQASLVLGVGFFVGNRVDRERNARRDAELGERERRASDARYRGLFDVAADAILVLDQQGLIVDSNTAAVQLLDRTREDLHGSSLEDLVPGFRPSVGAPQRPGDDLPITASARETAEAPLAIDGTAGRTWVAPVTVAFRDADGQPRVLAQLRNVTPAIERQRLLQSFARRTVAAREEERRRVARDLHDGPLQSLILVWRSLDEVEGSIPDEAGDAIREARRRAEDVADELRRFSRDLRPSILDDLGLAAALKAETLSFGGRDGVEATFTSTGIPERLPTEVELTLLRICQEALRNVERHARASRVAVALERLPGGYRMWVGDNGVGLGVLPPSNELVAAGRLGVVGMQERARLIGAACTVHDAAGWSTVVEVAGAVGPGGTTDPIISASG